MRHFLVAIVLAVSACSHDAKPAAEQSPPLPPASGTPIGYLIDAATDLSLRDDQLAKLRAIDTKLSAELDAIDKHDQPHATGGSPRQNPMGGRHHGGRGGHGRRAAGSDAPAVDKDAGARTNNDRVTDVKAALDEAFEILDDTQREQAHKVLADHGVDI